VVTHRNHQRKHAEVLVKIAKDQVIDFIKSQGQHDKAAQAEGELPAEVDTDRDAGLLEKFGINPQDLLSKLPGGIGGKIGDKFGL